jgi:hypothetical protein
MPWDIQIVDNMTKEFEGKADGMNDGIPASPTSTTQSQEISITTRQHDPSRQIIQAKWEASRMISNTKMWTSYHRFASC